MPKNVTTINENDLFVYIFVFFQMLSQLEFLRINECFKEPCLHNGQCQPLENGFVCQCLPGFWGIISHSGPEKLKKSWQKIREIK